MTRRCSWAENSPLLRQYHDNEWGKEKHDDLDLFELLTLEGFQAGLSWQLVLQRRDGMRNALDGFDWRKIMVYSDEKLEWLKQHEGMIKNRLKINALKTNAQAFERVRQVYGTFDAYIWSFTNGKTIVNCWEDESHVPSESELSQTISKALKQQGFKFVGSKIIYSYLQAIGIINDHVETCAFK